MGKKRMRIVPYEKLNDLQKEIASWPGDFDGGCSIETVVEEMLTDDLGHKIKDIKREKEIKREIHRMVATGILVKERGCTQLHYPGMRPNESRRVFEENKKGIPKTIKVKEPYNYTYKEKKVKATLPNGKTKRYESIVSAAKNLNVDAREVSKSLKGFGKGDIKFEWETVEKREKGINEYKKTIYIKPWKRNKRRRMNKKMNIVILTGAGISAPSGIATFRDEGGVWDKYDLKEVCTRTAYNTNPDKVKAFLKEACEPMGDKKPNAGHKALAKLEKYFKNVTIITQNIDDLHEKAGSERVLHVHGFYKDWDDEFGVVLFEDQLKYAKETEEALENADVYVAIGTSSMVAPACFYHMFVPEHCIKILINKEEDADLAQEFHKSFWGCVTTEVPAAVEFIKERCPDMLKVRLKEK